MSDDDIFLLVAPLVIIPLGIYMVYVLANGKQSLAALLRSFEAEIADQTEIAVFEFTFYYGVIAWFTQITVQVPCHKDRYEEAISRCFRWNMRWGLTAAGGLFVLILSVIDAQRAKANVQIVSIEPPECSPPVEQ